MPTAAGPNTFGEENLVFAYDLGDTANSYRGEPTENLLNNTTEFDSWTKARNSGTTPTVMSNTSPNPLGVPNAPMADTLVIPDDGTYPRIQQYFTPSSTNQHTMSVWIRSLSGDCDCFLGIFRNSPWSLPGHTVVSVTSEWQKFSFTMTPPDTTTHVAYIGSHDEAAQKGNTLELWGAQIEDKSHATSFTAGTRSATQGLIDITGNYSLDLSNVSFDSNAQMTFDGTDDVLPIGSSQNFPSQLPFTLEIWTYVTSLDAGGCMFMYQQNNGTYGGFEFWSNASGAIILNSNPTTNLVSTAAGVFTTNSWKHIVCTVDGSTASIYVDGGFDASNATGYPDNVNGIIEIGDWASPGYRVNGEIPVTKIYNRALTASEIKANYNAIKGRFNIE